MDREFEMVDLEQTTDEERAHWNHLSRLAFKMNHTMPCTDEYDAAVKDLFGENLGEGSRVIAPIFGACLDSIKIGRNSIIQSNI